MSGHTATPWLWDALMAEADKYAQAKRLKPVLSPDDERWNARMDGAENALRTFAALALTEQEE